MNWNCRTTASIIHYCTFHLFLNEKTLDLRFCFDFLLLIVSAVCFGKVLLPFFFFFRADKWCENFWSKQGSFGPETEFDIRACAYIRYQLQTFINVVINEIKRTTHFHPLNNVICRLKCKCLPSSPFKFIPMTLSLYSISTACITFAPFCLFM